MSLLWARDLDSVGALRASGPATLNWLFLVESCVIIVLVLFVSLLSGGRRSTGNHTDGSCNAQYFFYFSRVLGLVVAAILRLLLWKSNNAYFEVGSIQFSLLGGRITFSDLRYISRNQSLRIVEGLSRSALSLNNEATMLILVNRTGKITWRYWKWRVRSENDLPSGSSPAPIARAVETDVVRPPEARLPCRVTVTMQGAEWFLYNRTPSYDAILEELGLKDPFVESLSEPGSAGGSGFFKDRKHDPSEPGESVQDLVESGDEPAKPKKVPTDWLREALPIEIRCKTGSIIMGNPSTSNILIAGFEKVSGAYSAVKVRPCLLDSRLHPADAHPRLSLARSSMRTSRSTASRLTSPKSSSARTRTTGAR